MSETSCHDWDLDQFPGICKNCGANYLNTWVNSCKKVQEIKEETENRQLLLLLSEALYHLSTIENPTPQTSQFVQETRKLLPQKLED